MAFNESKCPQEWRNAIIIPLLKSGKDAGAIDSYRPISLTSCVVKLMERIIARRLIYMLDIKGTLSNTQCGGRAMRCCEDQIIRICQAVEDGFQQPKPHRTVMALFDYSKAFDRVWKQKLVLNMLEYNIPVKLVRWIAGFLENRQARVCYANSFSKTVALRQGVPQGSVLAPLLFLLFINPIAKLLPATNAMFVDDLSVWITDTSLEAAERRLQEAVNAVVEWSTTNKMKLNVSKSEATFFSNCSAESKWRPSITIGNKPMHFNENPRFLGVRLDRTITFNRQVETVRAKLKKKNGIISSLCNQNWGWRKKNARSLYFTTQRSILDYAAGGWHPWLSKTNMDKLDAAQNEALRRITGQASSTPLESLRLEAGVQSYHSRSKYLSATSYEKAIRLPANHPRKIASSSGPPKRLKRNHWKLQGETIHEEYSELKEYRPFSTALEPPWERQSSNWKIDLGTKDVAATNEFIRRTNATYTIYTDGSASEGTQDGGSAVVVTTGTQEDTNVLATLKLRGRLLTSSYEEEFHAKH